MGYNPKMLRLARQRKGFQQTDAARLLGLEQPILSRIENGFVEITGELASRASRVYELPLSFFEQTDPIFGAPVSVHPMWRRKADVSARDLDTIVAELNIRLMHLRRLLEAADVAHSSEIPKLDVDAYEDPEKIAALVRAHWRIPRGPIADLTTLVERAGVIVVFSSMGQTSVSGVTFSSPGLPPLIVLNNEQSADRIRFTLAHELGHLVMHRFPSPSMEEEANAFASALLMPEEDIRQYFSGRRVDLALLAAMKPEWRVSMQALLMRARSSGAITTNQSQYLWKQISMRRLRFREPPELDFPVEQPTVMSSLVRLHLDALGYSVGELAQSLHLLEPDLKEYYSLKTLGSEPNRPKLTILK
jgi:Zn-dependent peptidase ImmA (M78 family)/transcriptional regulator with XRE-family HTH domain